jgi:hypothetical protein
VRHLVLLREGDRFGLGAGARVVIAGERQNHHEAEQDREAGGQDAEDAGCTVAVIEVAAIRGVPADEQEGRDREPADAATIRSATKTFAAACGVGSPPEDDRRPARAAHHSHRMRGRKETPSDSRCAPGGRQRVFTCLG